MTDEQEIPFEKARRTMFAYLAGLIVGNEREQLKAFYEAEHASHSERHGACALCELDAVMSAMSAVSLPLLPVRAKRFRNTGNKHRSQR